MEHGCQPKREDAIFIISNAQHSIETSRQLVWLIVAFSLLFFRWSPGSKLLCYFLHEGRGETPFEGFVL